MLCVRYINRNGTLTAPDMFFRKILAAVNVFASVMIKYSEKIKCGMEETAMAGTVINENVTADGELHRNGGFIVFRRLDG